MFLSKATLSEFTCNVAFCTVTLTPVKSIPCVTSSSVVNFFAFNAWSVLYLFWVTNIKSSSSVSPLRLSFVTNFSSTSVLLYLLLSTSSTVLVKSDTLVSTSDTSSLVA
jgi:hypothetical protein